MSSSLTTLWSYAKNILLGFALLQGGMWLSAFLVFVAFLGVTYLDLPPTLAGIFGFFFYVGFAVATLIGIKCIAKVFSLELKPFTLTFLAWYLAFLGFMILSISVIPGILELLNAAATTGEIIEFVIPLIPIFLGGVFQFLAYYVGFHWIFEKKAAV